MHETSHLRYTKKLKLAPQKVKPLQRCPTRGAQAAWFQVTHPNVLNFC